MQTPYHSANWARCFRYLRLVGELRSIVHRLFDFLSSWRRGVRSTITSSGDDTSTTIPIQFTLIRIYSGRSIVKTTCLTWKLLDGQGSVISFSQKVRHMRHIGLRVPISASLAKHQSSYCRSPLPFVIQEKKGNTTPSICKKKTVPRKRIHSTQNVKSQNEFQLTCS